MPSAAMLTEQQIRHAMLRTLSNRSAARFLKVSFPTYKLYAKMYRDAESGKTLYELHKNRPGKGIFKYQALSKEPHLHKLLCEGQSKESYNIGKLKLRLLHEGYFAHECSRCSFREKRVIDLKVPLLLNFKNTDKSDWRIENLELLCYNCYYLHVGDIFTSREQRLLEDFGAPRGNKNEMPTFDLDASLLERIEKFTSNKEDGTEFISKF